jgi:hypothetical protein
MIIFDIFGRMRHKDTVVYFKVSSCCDLLFATSYLDYSQTQKIEAGRPSETLVNFYPITQHHIPKDATIHSRRSEIYSMLYYLSLKQIKYIYVKSDDLNNVLLSGLIYDLFIFNVSCNL